MASLQEESRGKLVLDCGATDNIVSVPALDAYVQRKHELREGTKVEIDPNDKVKFRFGDGRRETSLSLAKFHVKANGKADTISMRTLDTGDAYVPMLGGVSFLRKSGAVIDFTNGKCVLSNLDADRVIQLEESSSGLWMLDITKDLLAGSQPVSSLGATPLGSLASSSQTKH